MPELTEKKYIEPFLLLSLAESCFEHVLLNKEEQTVFEIEVKADSLLHVQVSFASSKKSLEDFSASEHLTYVRKKIATHYAGCSQFQINLESGLIKVDLKLPLYAQDLIREEELLQHYEATVV